MSRRAKRWALGVWAVLVVAGGGLTLLLQGPTGPDGAGRRPAPASSPSPVDLPCPGPTPDDAVAVGCAYKIEE